MDAQTGNEATPLQFACRAGFIDVVQFLLSRDTNITNGRQIGAQVLTVAAGKGDLEIIKLLVRYGADVSKHSGESMIRSAKEGRLEVLKYLKEVGASINYVNLRGFTPLLTATYFNRTDIVQYLLGEQASADVFTPNGNNGLVNFAVRVNNLDILTMLVERGFPINYFYEIPVKVLLTPLMSAAVNGFQEMVHFLLFSNASANMLNSNNDSALHLTSVIGRTDIFRLLLDYGADPLQRNTFGSTPPHLAAWYDRVDIIKLVIQRGYKINDFLSEDGYNLLHFAAANGSIHVMDYLLSTPDGKSVVNYKGKATGRSALHSASEKIGATKIAELLVDHGADINARTVNLTTPLMRASQYDNLDMVRFLVSKGADVHLVDVDGNSSLHIACDRGGYDVVDILLSNGAYVNVINKDRITPLHFATRHNVSLVELLLINKANPFAVDKYGSTVLHYAAGFGNLEVVKLLLQWDVNVGTRRLDGSSPMYLASQKGFKAVANFLASVTV